MAAKKTAATAKKTAAAATFSKSKIVGSKRFADHKDILNLKLNASKEYTIEECEAIINEFLENKKGE